MVKKGPAKKLTIYVDESDRYGKKPVYEVLIDIFYKKKIAGVSVFRGVAGYGSDGVYHTQKMLTLSEKMPIKVEAIDSEEMINKILPDVYQIVEKGLIGGKRYKCYKVLQRKRGGRRKGGDKKDEASGQGKDAQGNSKRRPKMGGEGS